MPFSTALPESGSTSDLVGQDVAVHAGVIGRDAHPDARRVVAPAVRDRDDAGHDRVGDLDRRLDLAGARSARAPAPPSVRPSRSRVVRVHVQRAAVLALHERPQVVHPGVVRAQLAAADQDDAAPLAARALERRPRSRSTSATIGSGASSILPDGVRSTSGMRGCERAEVDAVRARLEHVERQPSGSSPKPSP